MAFDFTQSSGVDRFRFDREEEDECSLYGYNYRHQSTFQRSTTIFMPGSARYRQNTGHDLMRPQPPPTHPIIPLSHGHPPSSYINIRHVGHRSPSSIATEDIPSSLVQIRHLPPQFPAPRPNAPMAPMNMGEGRERRAAYQAELNRIWDSFRSQE